MPPTDVVFSRRCWRSGRSGRRREPNTHEFNSTQETRIPQAPGTSLIVCPGVVTRSAGALVSRPRVFMPGTLSHCTQRLCSALMVMVITTTPNCHRWNYRNIKVCRWTRGRRCRCNFLKFQDGRSRVS